MESKTDILVEFTDAKGLNYDGMAYEIIRLRRAVEVCKDIRGKQASEIERLKNTIDHKEKLLCDYEGMISNAIEEIENAQLIDNTPKEAAVVRGELLNIFTGENEVSDAHTT